MQEYENLKEKKPQQENKKKKKEILEVKGWQKKWKNLKD